MTYCTQCGTPQPPGNRFCTGCGNQMSTAPPSRHDDDDWVTPSHTHPQRRLVIALTALVVLLGGGGVAAWAMLGRGTGTPAPPSPSPARPPGQPLATASLPDGSDALRTVSVSASCVSSPSQDAGGTAVTYGPEKAIDGLPDTAWRCDGDGVGQRLEISFPGAVTLTSIGLVPGYAKTDPYDGTDRYAQNRRISSVRYTFDDSSAITQSLDTGIASRAAQTVALPEVSTSHVTITILSSVRGETIGDQPPFDRVAISEITVSVR